MSGNSCLHTYYNMRFPWNYNNNESLATKVENLIYITLDALLAK